MGRCHASSLLLCRVIRTRRACIGKLALVHAVDLSDTWIKHAAYFDNFGAEYMVWNMTHIVLCMVAMVSTNSWFHAGFVVAGLPYRLSWIVRQFDTLKPLVPHR